MWYPSSQQAKSLSLYIEFKASRERSIPDQLNIKLLVAVNTFPPSNAACERGFRAINNIITDIENVITSSIAEKQLLISISGPLCEKWNPEPYATTWLEKRR